MPSALVALSRLTAPSEPHPDSRIADAREAFEYWSLREARLPWHRRSARREAHAMVATTRSRLIAAHLAHWRLGALGRAIAPLLLAPPRRTVIRRRIMFAAACLATVAFASVAAVTVAAVAVLT